MSTTDDIMAMRKACDMQGLSQEFEDLVAERDQLASYGEALNSRCIEDTKRTGELVAERDALRTALLEVLEFQSDPKAPTIHDFGRWRRLAQHAIAREQK